MTTDSGIVLPDNYKFFDSKLNYGLTQKQLEEKNGFKYSFIQDVIDQKPLLNQELQEQQLRENLNKQFGSLRESIYKKAFSIVER